MDAANKPPITEATRLQKAAGMVWARDELNRQCPSLSGPGIHEDTADVAEAMQALHAACRRLVQECPYICDADSCECGENGNGFDNAGNPCEHIQACRAIALAEGK